MNHKSDLTVKVSRFGSDELVVEQKKGLTLENLFTEFPFLLGQHSDADVVHFVITKSK